MYLQSASANDGSMSITVTFEIGTDPDISTLDVQNRVSIASPACPTMFAAWVSPPRNALTTCSW